jgi:hypothetical protein
MALKVIGAGMGRTGTHSLKLALEQLRLGPCHHMIELIQHPEQLGGPKRGRSARALARSWFSIWWR